MKKRYDILGMSCAACQAHVEKAIKKLDCVKDCNVNLLSNYADVTFNDEANDKAIIEAVKNAGYKVDLEKELNNKNKDYNLINLIISISLLLLLMYISMGHMIGLSLPSFLEDALPFALSQLVLTIPIAIIYRRYFISGYQKLFKGHPNMDSLVALSATFSLIYGLYAITMIIIGLNSNNMDLVHEYHHNLYFEGCAMILTLVSLGKYLESLSKNKTKDAISKLIKLVPNEVLIKDNDKTKIVNTNDVEVGDVAIYKAGDTISVDGVILNGNGSIMEANLTGEAMPIYKKADDVVYASTTLNSGYIEVIVSKKTEDNSINQIINLVEEASNSKAPISKFADKVSGIFVPLIMGIAAISFILFMIFTKDFALSFNMLCSVLVVACPCALGLATPVAIMVGVGKGASNGLLIKNAEILEKAHEINTVVLDKTGTITKGYPTVVEYISYSIDAYDIACSLENKTNHPLALAILNYQKEYHLYDVVDYSFDEGLGVKGKINDKYYYLGNMKMVEKYNLDTSLIKEKMNLGYTVLTLFSDEKILAIFMIKDEIRESSKVAISLLQKNKIEVVMLTGDNEVIAKEIADEVGIKKVIANVLPQDKSKIIKELMEKKKYVAMVGDGVNDSVALKQAFLGIAIGSGSDIALDSSDIILQRNDLMDVLNVISLSKRVLKTIKINLFWAFFYNMIGVIIASGLLYPINHEIKLSPMICSILMSFSSVFVVLNALTINFFKIKREKKEEIPMQEVKINVDGMMCKMCKKHVEEACLSFHNVTKAIASLEDKNVLVSGQDLDIEAIKQKIREAGYEA